MKERLLGFIFCGVLIAFAVNLATDRIHTWLFPDSLVFETYWYVPFLIVPAACLLSLAWVMGFFRTSGPRWADALALMAVALLLYLTVGANYACWHYCF